jgi:DTW domain-containing protein YfiP
MVKTIWLLTHPTEFNKPSNTGHLVASSVSAESSSSAVDVRVVAWSRVYQEPTLLTALKEPSLLVFPSEQAVELDVAQPELDLTAFSNLLIIDATWQLARKIYNQSPYLHTLPSIKLVGAEPSRYLLRRNQLQTGWCTAEIAVILLRLLQYPVCAETLATQFSAFNQRNN